MKREHVFRQSTLDTFTSCPEKARRYMTGEVERTDSDATAVGTAVHSGIQQVLEADINGDAMSLDAMISLAHWEFMGLKDGPGFRWIQLKSVDQALAMIQKLCHQWYEYIYSQGLLDPVATEIEFGPLLLHEDDERVIRLTGTVDYLDAGEVPTKDWKTANHEYKEWEYKRWAIQPTVYTWALVQLGLIPPADEIPFEYVVLRKDQDTPQLFCVRRHAGDWEWLKQRAIAVAKLVEAELDVWPMVDTSWKCSAKWCEVFAAGQCKGSTRTDADRY